jgi:hypothetical protein
MKINEEQIRAYYGFMYKWFKEHSLTILDGMVGALGGLSDGVLQDRADEVSAYQKELALTRGLVLDMPSPIEATIVEIENFCKEVLEGKLIWASQVPDNNKITMENYSKYILELM